MAVAVIHPARVAWDFAQQAVSAASSAHDDFGWFHAKVGTVLGDAHQQELAETRARIAAATRDDVRQVELGRWRVRAEDELMTHPDLAEDLQILVLAARQRSAGA
jgi:hypothetical protein